MGKKFQLKTERERVAERIIRLGKKWEAEHQMWEEQERQNEAQMKVKEMELLASDKKHVKKLENSSAGRAEKGSRKGEMNLDHFLKKERQLMMTRLKPKDKKFVPFTKDLRVVDAKFVQQRKMEYLFIPKINTHMIIFFLDLFC